MRFKRIWKRGEDAYNWRVNRRARRYIYETGGSSQSCLVSILTAITIIALVIGAVAELFIKQI